MQRVDIRKYPLTYRLLQALYKNEASKKAIDIIFDKKIVRTINQNYSLNEKYESNKYLTILKNLRNSNSYGVMPARKIAYIPNNNANYISLTGKKAYYYSYNYIKKNAEVVESLLTDVIDNNLLYHVKYTLRHILGRDKANSLTIHTERHSAANRLPVPGYDMNTIGNLCRHLKVTEGVVKIKLKGEDIIVNSKKTLTSGSYKNLRLHIFSEFINNHKELIESYRSDSSFISNLDGYLSMKLPKEECKIGKVFNKIFDLIKASEIEEIINCYIGIVKIPEEAKDQIVELTGDEIVEFYNKHKYLGYSDMSGGSLNSSCMKYVICRDRFDIYKKNPGIIKMIVVFSKDFKKIEARALLWDDKYLDRIYYNREDARRLILSYSVSKGYSNANRNNGSIDVDGQLTVQLKHWKFDSYPYLDTFNVINQVTGEIYGNFKSQDEIIYSSRRPVRREPEEHKALINCRNHSTGMASDASVGRKNYSKLTVYSNEESMELPIDKVVYSKILDSFIHKDKALYIDGLDDFDNKTNHKLYDYCIKINSGSDKDNILFKSGLYPVSESVFVDELSFRVHISCLNFNEETCEFELVYPDNSTK